MVVEPPTRDAVQLRVDVVFASVPGKNIQTGHPLKVAVNAPALVVVALHDPDMPVDHQIDIELSFIVIRTGEFL